MLHNEPSFSSKQRLRYRAHRLEGPGGDMGYPSTFPPSPLSGPDRAKMFCSGQILSANKLKP